VSKYRAVGENIAGKSRLCMSEKGQQVMVHHHQDSWWGRSLHGTVPTHP